MKIDKIIKTIFRRLILMLIKIIFIIIIFFYWGSILNLRFSDNYNKTILKNYIFRILYDCINVLKIKDGDKISDKSGLQYKIKFLNTIKLENKIDNVRNNFDEFVFFGDAIPHKSIKTFLKNNNIKVLLQHLLNINLKSSLNFYNLETTILDSSRKSIPFIFSADPTLINSLDKLHISCFTIANNHILDFGEKGFSQTIKNIKNYNYTGLLKNKTLFLRKIKYKEKIIGIIGITLIMNDPEGVFNKIKKNSVYPAYFSKNIKTIVDKINKVKNKNLDIDYLIVSLHWGNEYEKLPTDFQIELSKKLIDNGVDIVWGHHPHVIQPLLIYKGKPIIFSNGNFFSGQALSKSSYLEKSIHKNYFFSRGIPVIKLLFKDKKLKTIIVYFYFCTSFNNKIILIPLKQTINFKQFFSKYFIDKKNIPINNNPFFKLNKSLIFNNNCIFFNANFIDLLKTYNFMQNSFFYYFKNKICNENNLNMNYTILNLQNGFKIIISKNPFNYLNLDIR